jgi:hypothetical protein
MGTMEILLEEKTELKVGTKTYKVGSLGYRQIVKLSEWIKEILPKLTGEIKGQTNAHDLMLILSQIGEDSAAKFFSIILNDDDTVFIKESILDSGKVTSQIVKTILELNADMFANFQAAAALIKQPTATSTPPSL